MRTCLLILAAPLMASCSDPTCTLNVLPAVVVEIRDAVTGTPIAESASGSVRDRTYTDSLRPAGFLGDILLSRAAAEEREGTYTVEVVHQGYVTWQRAGVRAGEDGCHVQTVTLQANLDPAP